ncbi:MAG: glycerol kinase GlpK [Actinobacteria bacterium]|nr:glycerol kinase GlpK [Actinomycetota bacterium]
MSRYVAAIDQGTSSSRCLLFDRDGAVAGAAQREHAQLHPQSGWVEHDPLTLVANVRAVIDEAVAAAGASAADVAAVGITNQRETTVVWERASGAPVANAIVWQDVRTAELVAQLADGDADRLRATTGLPLSTYFSGPKVRWLLDADPALRARAEAGELCFGTIDSWLIWQLTGGPDGGVHVTDVTNASRTLLMDLRTLDWSPQALDLIGVPRALLPQIRSSSEVYGELRAGTALDGVPIAGVLGDQQAALFGQACFEPGEAKNTYGTGCFLLVNTGAEPVASRELLTTVAYRLGEAPPAYALEGSIAVAGAAVRWLRDQLGVIGSADEVEALAASVPDTGDVYVVPAFSGLFAPRWRADARGAIVGLTAYTTKAHIARAVLEATAWQTREVLDAVRGAAGIACEELKVDGGMTVDELLMQFQADVLGVPAIRPQVSETTALGAAYAAGLATGVWSSPADVRANWRAGRRWEPRMDPDEVARRYARWREAVERSLNWISPAPPAR